MIKLFDKNIYSNNNLWNKNFIHTSSINYMSNVNSSTTQDINNLLNSTDSPVNNNKALVLYENFVDQKLNSEGSSSTLEAFPWFFDANGKAIDYNKEINVFQAVEIISRFLEAKYHINPDSISGVKISQLLSKFDLENKKVTVLELYNHVSSLYNKDKEFFENTVQNLNDVSIAQNENILKPLGEYGDITLNQICNKLKDLKWESVVNNGVFTVNLIPFCANLVGYGFILRSYVKHVYNQPYQKTGVDLNLQKAVRNRNLAIFSLVGAPLTLVLLKALSPSLKEIISVSFPIGNESQLDNNKNLLPGFTVFSFLNKKIPNWLKLLFKLLLLSLLVLKLLGINILDFMNSLYYLRMYCYVSCTLVIFYQLLNIYLVHKFSNKNIKISKVLPDFLINWLKEFEEISSSVENIKEFKKTCYIEICIYLSIIIIITLIF